MEFKEDIIQGVLNASPNNDDPERHFQELMQLTPESIPVDPIKSVFDSTEMYYGDTIPEGLVSDELSPDLAAERGLRYHFAMGSRSPGLDQMSFDLMQGKEGELREGEYLNRILEDKTMRSKLIDEIISTGKEPDQETIDFVSNLSNNEVLEASHSPGTIMEKMATEKLMSNALANPIDDEYLISVNQDIPDSVIDWSNRGTTYSLIARKYVEDQNKILEQQGWGSFLLDLGENFIPFLEWYRLSDVTELGSDTSFLLGNNLQDQVAEMYLLPTAEEFDAKFKETMDKLNAVNPQTAMQFAMAVMGYSTTDRFLSNTFSTLDLTTLATPAVAAASRLKGVAQAAGSASTRSLAAKMAATAGNQADLAQAVVEKAGKTGRISDFNEMMMQVPSIHNPGAILRDPQGLLSTTADEAARLKNILEGQSAALVKGVIVDPIKLDRLTPEQRVAAYAAAREKFDEVYPHMNTAVIDVKPIDGLEEALTNVDAIAIEIGSPSGKLFGSERLARTYAKQYGIAQPVIKDRGGLFYIEVIQHVDETDPRVLNALKVSTSVTPPDSVLNRFAGWFRSKDDLVSEEIAKDYAVSAMSSKGMLNAAKQIRRTIEDLPGASTLDKWLGKNSSRQDFETFIKSEQTWTKNGQNGKFSSTLVELESNWRKQFSRLPTEQEKLAYFSYIQLNDIDWTLRNLNIHRDKTRIGLRSINLNFGSGKTGFFEGKILTKFPTDIPENAGILVWDGNPGTKPLFRSKNFTKPDVIEDLEKQGYKLIQLSPYGEADFRSHLTNLIGRTKIDSYLPPRARIHYVFTKQFDDKVLPFKQIPYQPGGHRLPQDPWVVRQPNISTSTVGLTTESVYYGDNNLFSAGSRLEAEKMAELVNTARIMLRQNDPQAKAFVESNLAVSFSTFKRKMTDLDSPVLVTPINQSAWKTHNISALHDQANGKLLYPNLRNDKENGHNVYKGQVDLEFASERGETMFSLKNTGTLDNPVFNFKRGDLIDPIPSMDRTLSSLLKGVVLDDMKRKSTTQFVEVFADVLDGDLADMRRNPYATLLSPKWKTSVPGEKRNLLAAAKNYRRATLEFLNLETEAQRDSNVILQKFSDSVTSKLGLQRKDVTHKYEWFKETDPTSYLRGWVFDAKMGFFSPVQMPLQAITSFHAMAVEGPVRGGQALANAFLLRAALARPSMLDGVATKAMGMTKEQFTESFNMMKRMNWDNVGYEVSNLDAMMSSGVVESAVDRGREAGRFFFKQGEQWTRLVAWNAASLRWYADNPGQKMGVRAAQEVLKRADLLSVNMTSASNASWQKGIASIPTQFSAYPMRLAEQLMPGLSGRLTPMEKTKAFLTYSILFGVPFAASGTVGVWPIHKEIRQQLLERGVDVDEGSIAKYMSDGILGSLADMINDRDWNFSERFGPSGTPFFSDLITGDKTFTEFLLGATGSTIGDTLKAMMPFAWSVTSIFSDNDEAYPLTMSDFHNLASTITTYSLGQKAWAVYNTGNYVGRSGVVLDEDLNSWDALVVGLTGMQTQRTSDAFILQKSDRDLRDLQQNARKEITKNLDMMFKSEDDEERINYAKRAKAWYKAGGFRPDQAPAILSGVGDQKSLSDKAEENFSKRSPEDQKRYLEKIIRRQGNN